MKTATISKLKATLSEYIRYVKKGEQRGRPVARLVPVDQRLAEEERVKVLIEQGAVRPGTGRLGRVLAGMPLCRVPEGTVQKLIDES